MIINNATKGNKNYAEVIKKLEKKIKFKISSKQNFIEYSSLSLEYLKNIANKIILNDGGILIVDYGYSDKKMKNTLQAVSKKSNDS